MEPYQVLPLQVRVNLGVIAIKEYFTFPKAHHIQDSRLVGGLLLCWDAVSVFTAVERNDIQQQ